jgi:hypothetical protein
VFDCVLELIQRNKKKNEGLRQRKIKEKQIHTPWITIRLFQLKMEMMRKKVFFHIGIERRNI